MSKGTKILITILVLITIVSLVVATIAIAKLSEFVVNDSFGEKSDNVESDEPIYKDSIDTKNDNINAVEENTNNSNLSQEEFDNIVKDKIEGYMNLDNHMYASSDGALASEYLGFYSSYEEIGKNTKKVDGVLKTNIKYEDFINKVTKYMTKEMFDSMVYSTCYINNNGMLDVNISAAGRSTYKVSSVSLLSKSEDIYTYSVKYNSYSGDFSINDAIITLKVKKVGNEYVVCGRG